MVKLLTVNDIAELVNQVGFASFITQLVAVFEADLQHWQEFKKDVRHATHYPYGVIELMPTSGNDYYAFKYVNGHPQNPQLNKLTVCAVGMLAEVVSGYPLLLSEMTILTALRTAATAVLAAKYLAKSQARIMAMVGTGAQAEFQALAFQSILHIDTIKYYDIDPQAMQKFANNLSGYSLKLEPADSINQAIAHADIITTATADKTRSLILKDEWIKPGMHINALGGDCPGKTELDPNILHRGKIVVEYAQQSLVEGEMQNVNKQKVYAELWELVQRKKPGRENDKEITVFDSVGFAIEDYSTLRYVYHLAEKLKIGKEVALIPTPDDPKNLFQILTTR